MFSLLQNEFESLRKNGELPPPNMFHYKLFPCEEVAGGHIYGVYEEYLEYYKSQSLPAPPEENKYK